MKRLWKNSLNRPLPIHTSCLCHLRILNLSRMSCGWEVSYMELLTNIIKGLYGFLEVLDRFSVRRLYKIKFFHELNNMSRTPGHWKKKKSEHFFFELTSYIRNLASSQVYPVFPPVAGAWKIVQKLEWFFFYGFLLFEMTFSRSTTWKPFALRSLDDYNVKFVEGLSCF